MNSDSLTIWCNAYFPDAVWTELRDRLKGHSLIRPAQLQTSNLVASGPDPLLPQADIALGQPDPAQAMEIPRLRWVHLTSAGYTRYDRKDIRQALGQRGAVMTNSSAVYAEPCAEHVFSMMLAMARRLPQCMTGQMGSRPWNAAEQRIQCQLLTGQSVLILGYGAIAARLVELLSPLRMRITAVRRSISGKEVCPVVTPAQMDALLPRTDHVVNVLPANPDTENFLNRHRLEMLAPSAIVYNIGRGTTIDQAALLEMLTSRRLAGAYLDVSDPEPLPPAHPLWSAPNCFITPHAAGGHSDEFVRLGRHFLDNFDRFIRGEPLADRII